MQISLKDKRALVTGSTSGIGAATARVLAGAGAHVVVHGRDADRAEAVAADIVAAGGRATIVLGDVASDDDVTAMAMAIDERLGGLDILVSNAADPRPFVADWFDADSAQWLAGFDGNVIAMTRLARAFVPRMRHQGWGRIVAVGSNAYTNPTLDFPVYAAAKAALFNVTMALARTLAKTGITANIVSPGSVRTAGMAAALLPMAQARGWEETDPDAIEARLIREKWPNLVGRMGRPDEIASAIAFLASDHAAYITGSNLRIDGGETAWVH